MILDIVNRSNQRGGRMLSVIDLIEAGTLTCSQAAWLLARIVEGSSWFVGARPGGAGKTTIMSAFLAMAPDGNRAHITNPGSGWERAEPGECVVCFEIGPGGYDGYIWGRDVSRLAQLATRGCRIVTNLHADTLDEARRQVVDQCGASPSDFNALGIFLPISFKAGRRTISYVNYFDGSDWLTIDQWRKETAENDIAGFLDGCLGEGVRKIEEVRSMWLEFVDGGSATGSERDR